MPGDWMSVSITPTWRPRPAYTTARFAVVFDLPVPPRNEWTLRMFATRPPLARVRLQRGPGHGKPRVRPHGSLARRASAWPDHRVLAGRAMQETEHGLTIAGRPARI